MFDQNNGFVNSMSHAWLVFLFHILFSLVNFEIIPVLCMFSIFSFFWFLLSIFKFFFIFRFSTRLLKENQELEESKNLLNQKIR